MQKQTNQLLKRSEKLDRKHFILLRKNFSNNYIDNIIYPVDILDGKSGLIVIKYNSLEIIELIECHIDIYLLKDIILHNRQSLINLSLIYCTFYSIEKPFLGETFEKERHLADFLNLINFVSLIRSFEFQDIKNIVFKPLQYSSIFQHQIKRPIDYDEKNLNNFTIYNNKKGEQILPISIKKYDIELYQLLFTFQQCHDRIASQQSQKILIIGQNRQIEVTPELKKLIAQKVKSLDSSQYVQNEIELKQFEINNLYNTQQTQQGKFDVEELIINLHKKNVQNSQEEDPQGVQSQCDQMITDIYRNVSVFTQKIKFCMEQIQKAQVLIIKDNILSFQDSFEQMRFLIDREKKNIKRVIFSQNYSFSKQLFSQIVVELHKIQDIQEICFIQTVLQENAFNMLLNLIHIKKIKYMIIYKSYFLQNEIETLLNQKCQPINHNSYFLLDIQSKQYHQFLTRVLPNYDMLLSYENEPFKLSQNELVYLNFQKISDEKKNLVNFYIQNQLLERNSDISEEFINKYKDLIYDQATNQIQNNIESIIQNEDIETLIKQDDINILNFPILISILSSFKDIYDYKILKKYYLKPISSLKSIKSNINLIKFFDIKYFLKSDKQEDSQNNQDRHFKMNYEMFYDFYKCYKYNKQILKGDIVQEKIKNIHPWILLDPDFKCCSQNVITFQGNRALCFLNILNEINAKAIEQLKIGIDLSELFMNNIQFDLTQFNKIIANLVELHLEKFNFLFDMNFLNDVFEKSNLLSLLNLSDMSLTNDRIKNIQFSKVPKTLKIFNISENPAIQNMSFLNDLFMQCSKLEALGLRNIDLFFQQKLSSIQFQLIPESLEKIDLSFNQIPNQKQIQLDFINQIIRRCFKLTHIFLINCNLSNFNIAPINFDLLKQNPLFAKFDIKGNKCFKSLNFLNGILDNCQSFTSLQLMDMNLNISKIKTINFMNCRNLTQLNLSQNKSIDNFSFLNEIFYFAPNLSSLILQDVGFQQDKLINLNIEQLGKQLTELNISNNKEFDAFEFLNTFFPLATQLVELNLSDINLNDQQMQFIAFETIESQNITSITLTHNKIRKNFVRLFQLLKKRDYNIFINFEYDKIDNQMFRKFLKLSNTSFEKTLAYQNLLNDQQHVEAEAFLEREQRKFLQTQQELVQKQSSYNFYRSNGFSNDIESRIQKLEPSTQQKQQLEEFIVNQMRLTQKLEEEYMKGFISYYDFELDQASQGQLSTINFRNLKCLSGIDVYSCRKDCLKYLIKLDMTGFSCSQGSFQFLNYLFLYATQLKILNISRCELSDDDVHSINFKSNSLENLDLSFNDQIQDFSFINKLLQNCQKLKVLRLQDMDLNDEKIQTIDFKCLRFTKLKIIDFSYNYSIQDFDFINKILDHAPKLEELLFLDIDVVDTQINQILFYKLKYTNLKKFVLSQNDQLTNYFFLNLIINYSPQLDHIIISHQDIYKDPEYYIQKQEGDLQNTHAISQSPNYNQGEFSTPRIAAYLNQNSINQFYQNNSSMKGDHLLLSKYAIQDQKQNQFRDQSESNSNLQKKTSFNSLIVSRFQQDQNFKLNQYQEAVNDYDSLYGSNQFKKNNSNLNSQSQIYSSRQAKIQQQNGQEQNNYQSIDKSQNNQDQQFEENIDRMNQDIYDILASNQLGFSRRRASLAFAKQNSNEKSQQIEVKQEQNNYSERQQSPSEEKQQQINERRLSYQSKSSLKQNANKSLIEENFKQSQNVRWADQNQQDNDDEQEDIQNAQIEQNQANISNQFILNDTSQAIKSPQLSYQNQEKPSQKQNYINQPLISTNQETKQGQPKQQQTSLQQKILDNHLKYQASPQKRGNNQNSQNNKKTSLSPDQQGNQKNKQLHSPSTQKSNNPQKNKSNSPQTHQKNSPKTNQKQSNSYSNDKKNSPQSNNKNTPQNVKKSSPQNNKKNSPQNISKNGFQVNQNPQTQISPKEQIEKNKNIMNIDKQQSYRDKSNDTLTGSAEKKEVKQNSSIIQENDNNESYQIVNMNDMQVLVSSQDMQRSEIFDSQEVYNKLQGNTNLISQEFDDLKCYQNSLNLQQFLKNQTNSIQNNQRQNQDDYSVPSKSRISLDIFYNPKDNQDTANSTNSKVQQRDKKRKVFLDKRETAPQVQSSLPTNIKQNGSQIQQNNQQLFQESQQDSFEDHLPQQNSVFIQQKKKEKKHTKKVQQKQKIIKTPFAFLKDVFQKSQQLVNKIEKEVEDKGGDFLKTKNSKKIKMIDFNKEANKNQSQKQSGSGKKQDIYYSDYYNNQDYYQIDKTQDDYNKQKIQQQQTPSKQNEKYLQTYQKSETKKQNLSKAELDFAEEFEQMIIDNQKWKKSQEQKQRDEQFKKLIQSNQRYQEQQIPNSPYRNYFLQEKNIQRPYQSSSQFNSREYTQINFIKPRSQQQNRTKNQSNQQGQPHLLEELSQKQSYLKKIKYENLVQENLIQIQNQIETLQGNQSQLLQKSKTSIKNNNPQLEQSKFSQKDSLISNQSLDSNKKQHMLNLLDSKSSFQNKQKQRQDSPYSIGRDSLLNNFRQVNNHILQNKEFNNLTTDQNQYVLNQDNLESKNNTFQQLSNNTLQQQSNTQLNDLSPQDNYKYLKVIQGLDNSKQQQQASDQSNSINQQNNNNKQTISEKPINEQQIPKISDNSQEQKQIKNQLIITTQNLYQYESQENDEQNLNIISSQQSAEINSKKQSLQLLSIMEEDNLDDDIIKVQIQQKKQNSHHTIADPPHESKQGEDIQNNSIQQKIQAEIQQNQVSDQQNEKNFQMSQILEVQESQFQEQQQDISVLVQKDIDNQDDEQGLLNQNSQLKNQSQNQILGEDVNQKLNSEGNRKKESAGEKNDEQLLKENQKQLEQNKEDQTNINQPQSNNQQEQQDFQEKFRENQQTIQEITQVDFTQANENSVLYQKNLDISQIDNDQSNILIIQADEAEEQDQVNDLTDVKLDQENSQIYQIKTNYQELEEQIIQIQQQDQNNHDEMSDSQQNFDNFQKQLQKFQEDEDEYLEYLQTDKELNFKNIRNSETEVIELRSLKGDLVQEMIESIMQNASNSLKILRLEDLDLSNFGEIDPSKSKLDLQELSLKKTIIPNLDFLNMIAGYCNKDLIRLNIQDLEIAQKKVTSNLQLKIFQQLLELSVSGKSTPQIFQNCSYFNLILNKCQSLQKLTIVNSHLDFQNIKIIHYKNLREIDFSHNSKIQVNFLNELIKNAKNLIHLKLNGIQLTNEKANQLNFQNISRSLQTISLADNPLDFSHIDQLKFLKEIVKHTQNSLQYFVIDHVFIQPYHILQRVCIEEDIVELSESEKQQQDSITQKEAGKQKKIKFRALIKFVNRNQLNVSQIQQQQNESFEDNLVDIIFKDRTTCENIILNDLICGSIIQNQEFYLQNRNFNNNLLIFSPLEIRFQMINFKSRLTLSMLSKFTSEGQNNIYNTIMLGNQNQKQDKQSNRVQMISNCYEYILGFSCQKNEIFETFYKQYQSKDESMYFDLFSELKSNNYSELKRVYLPLNLSLKIIQKQMTELQVIEMLNFMPPQQLIIKQRLSNQLLKCWYCINYLSPLTFKSKMQFLYDEKDGETQQKQQIWYEKSLANQFVDYYYNRQVSQSTVLLEVVKKFCLYVFYVFFNALSSVQKPFLFDFTVIEFNNKLEYNAQNEAMLFILYIIYLLIAIACVSLFNIIGFQSQQNISQIKINSINHIIFIIFQVAVFFIDMAIVSYFKHSLKTIQQKSMSFHKFKYLSAEMSFYLIQIKQFLLSQIKAFSFYFNYCFITITIIDNNLTFIILSGIFFCFYILIDFFSLFHLLAKLQFTNKKYQLCTERIDKLIILTQITNLLASNNFIREYSPSNYLHINNKLIDKTLLAEQLQLLLYSLPLVIIQLAFYKNQGGQYNSVIEASIAFNFIYLILNLIHILSYNPTQVNQEMFDELNEKKKNELQNIYESKLFDLQKYQIKKQYHENLKCLRFSQQKKREELLKLGQNRIIYQQYFESDQGKYQNLMNEIQYNLDITQYYEQ